MEDKIAHETAAFNFRDTQIQLRENRDTIQTLQRQLAESKDRTAQLQRVLDMVRNVVLDI